MTLIVTLICSWFHDLFVFGKSTYLKKVGDRGHGIFAHIPIPRGTYIGEFTGIVQRKHTTVPPLNSEYIMELDWLPQEIDPTTYGSGVSRINHHCNPNCAAKVVIHDKMFKIVVVAKRDIEENEELSLNYLWIHEKKQDAPVLH